MPVLHVGDIEIVAQTQQLTSPSIHIKKSDGEMYYVALSPLGGGIFDGSETLVYSESSINKCHSINLEPGIYRVEMRGGTGGKPYRCTSGSGMTNAMGDIVSSIFKLNETTTVYSLRGGDGNNSPTIGTYQIPGGGASGVDSILVVGERVWRANGGSGKTCIMPTQGAGLSTSGSGVSYGNGFGGNSDLTGNKNGFRRFYISNPSVNTSISSIGGGGGGGPNNAGGSNWSAQSNFPDDKIIINAGDNGTTKSGGNGGSINSCINMDCSETLFVSGGAGGANVSYECGGQMAYSYGGGGGGGAIYVNTSSSYYAKGGDGGSGSTGKSDTSFLRIYKM